MEMAKIGPGVAGGNNRQTLDRRRRRRARPFSKIGVQPQAVQWGWIKWAICLPNGKGADPDALPVYVGSHLDTQPTGGKYDGVLGCAGRVGNSADPQ